MRPGHHMSKGKKLSPKLAILKYTHQRKIEKPSGVIYIHHPMLPAKFYCFNIAKTNASISLELVKNATGRVRELNNIHRVGSEYPPVTRSNHRSSISRRTLGK